MKKTLACFLVINTTLFIITLAISFTILFRPFYYWHINYLNLGEQTGLTYNEIREAYDDVIDYTTLNKEFSTGILKYSDDGKDHFRDCKRLFTINFVIFGISSIILIWKKKYCKDVKLFNHSIGFCSGILNICLFFTITLIALFMDFDKFYALFHNIIFQGKGNWIFDPTKDEIIKILPNQYFINCGILIVSIISILSIIFVIRELDQKRCIIFRRR